MTYLEPCGARITLRASITFWACSSHRSRCSCRSGYYKETSKVDSLTRILDSIGPYWRSIKYLCQRISHKIWWPEKLYLLLHAIWAQNWVLSLGPMHAWPPYWGSGSLHARYDSWTAPPQVAVQGVQEPHCDQAPSVGQGSIEHTSVIIKSPADKHGV